MSYVNKLKKIAQDLALEDRIIFHPAVPHEELLYFTGMADVGLCNIENVCLSYYYSLPNKLFEYIQALVPIIGSDFPEISNIVRRYGIGECCKPDDASSIADAISRIIRGKNNVHLRNNLSKAKNELCWEKESRNLIAAYKKLLVN